MIPSAAEARFISVCYGTAEAVPFQNREFFGKLFGCLAVVCSGNK
jgi:hypothetical protein